jgi:hypothetical protein
MAERTELPDAPPMADCAAAAVAFMESASYNEGAIAKMLREQIAGGRLIFKAPDRIQMTKTGFDYLNPETL